MKISWKKAANPTIIFIGGVCIGLGITGILITVISILGGQVR